eukprot:tig00000939_g5482.t1
MCTPLTLALTSALKLSGHDPQRRWAAGLLPSEAPSATRRTVLITSSPAAAAVDEDLELLRLSTSPVGSPIRDREPEGEGASSSAPAPATPSKERPRPRGGPGASCGAAGPGPALRRALSFPPRECWDFKREGRCPFGGGCQYTHGAAEYRAVIERHQRAVGGGGAGLAAAGTEWTEGERGSSRGAWRRSSGPRSPRTRAGRGSLDLAEFRALAHPAWLPADVFFAPVPAPSSSAASKKRGLALRGAALEEAVHARVDEPTVAGALVSLLPPFAALAHFGGMFRVIALGDRPRDSTLPAPNSQSKGCGGRRGQDGGSEASAAARVPATVRKERAEAKGSECASASAKPPKRSVDELLKWAEAELEGARRARAAAAAAASFAAAAATGAAPSASVPAPGHGPGAPPPAPYQPSSASSEGAFISAAPRERGRDAVTSAPAPKIDGAAPGATHAHAQARPRPPFSRPQDRIPRSPPAPGAAHAHAQGGRGAAAGYGLLHARWGPPFHDRGTMQSHLLQAVALLAPGPRGALLSLYFESGGPSPEAGLLAGAACLVFRTPAHAEAALAACGGRVPHDFWAGRAAQAALKSAPGAPAGFEFGGGSVVLSARDSGWRTVLDARTQTHYRYNRRDGRAYWWPPGDSGAGYSDEMDERLAAAAASGPGPRDRELAPPAGPLRPGPAPPAAPAP